MDHWTDTGDGYREKTVKQANVPKNIITVHRPELTEAERTKRMATIKDAAVRLIIAAEQNKSNNP